MEYDFSDKVVLVTGASAGIGEEIAVLFARLGAKVALVGRNEGNLRAAAARCESERGVTPFPIIADLGTDEGAEKTAKDTLEHFGRDELATCKASVVVSYHKATGVVKFHGHSRIDILVNNAAIGGTDTIEHSDMALYDKLFSINLRGVFNLTRLVVPALIQSKGNIVNISSIAGTSTTLGVLAYSMTKAALDHFSRLTALELAPKGVRVNTVSPGVTISKFYQRMTDVSDQEYADFVRGTEQVIPMGKACTGEDIARAVVHLASDNSRLVTGSTLQVDGGLQYVSLGNVVKDSMQ